MVIARPQRVEDDCRAWARRLEPFLCDTEHLLHRWLDEGQSLLFEGAQGSLLDVDHGTYPFVTSSSPTAGGAATGTGVPPTAFDGVLGIVKAYTTRVGGGPFPGELLDEQGEYLRKRGNEFGTVTGRPRRCGWFDTVAVRYAQRLNGAQLVALTKLDVLDELAEIPVCVGYRIQGAVTRELPSRLDHLEHAEPVYKTLPGWRRTRSASSTSRSCRRRRATTSPSSRKRSAPRRRSSRPARGARRRSSNPVRSSRAGPRAVSAR